MINIKKMFSYQKNKGFTLAEVLITITIIGIIASMTITVLIAEYQKNYTAVQLKKVFSLFEQAFRSAAAFNYEPRNWIMQEASPAGSYAFFKKYMFPYLHISKDCETDTSDDCAFSFHKLDGTADSLDSNYARFILNDGTFAAIRTVPNANPDTKRRALYFYIDINGRKPLNVVGRDIFIFEYWLEDSAQPNLAYKMLPYGHGLAREALMAEGGDGCAPGGNGGYCAALIMNDNWEVKHDYPWAQARYASRAESSGT